MKTITNKKSVILTILFTSSNVLYTLTNLTGEVILWTSAGSKKVKGTKKVTSTTILVITKFIIKRITELGYKYMHIKLKGFKKNKKIALKHLKTKQVSILSVCDNSALAHNGCKQPKTRRI
uniref:ribosomal protein S11 n=1 Tax=Grateloupia turuturu TaxID=118375 RepID=UPI0027A16C8F|nr:ribosomal protein S11 [Grateloupia turuturu]YP_010986428.1 ribosomal protein S11 [Pachymeniopsis lanceolata]WIM51236.1 ribosomal protein S11 [Grateloupia turuturu]WOL37396.1 ribosomal protein S11 [Pachymeniopsis lanceolata]